MALYLRLSHKLAKLGAKNGDSLGRVLAAGIHLESKKFAGGWDANVPEGYVHIYLPKKDLPDAIPDGELTPEKRAELAAKYNLRPEDYKPLLNNGDYPELPFEGANDRDPWYDWDDVRLRRNYGEPMHVDIDILDRMSPLDRKPMMADWNQMIKVLGTAAVSLATLFWIGEYFPRFKPVAPRQFPEWYSSDDRFDGNLKYPGEFVKMGREIQANYDFPKN